MALPRSPLVVFVLAAAACSSAPPPSGSNVGQWRGPQGGYGPQGAPGQAPAPAVNRPVNVQAILALQKTLKCAPKEVAPGEWATFDCWAQRLVSKATQLVLPGFTGGRAPSPSRPSGGGGLVTGGSGPITGGVSGAGLPAFVDHRMDNTEGPIKSQGAVGACTAFSLSTAMDNAVRRMGHGDTVAPLHVWSKYAVPVMGVAGDETVNASIALEGTWPYDPAKACKLTRVPFDACSQAYGVPSGTGDLDPQLRAERASADAQGRYRLAGLEQLHAKPADTNEIAAVLAGGDDVWASFSVNDDAWMNRSLNSSVIPNYEADSDEGHAVVLAGYRTLGDGSRQFLVHNSWGTKWGENGYGWLPEAMVAKHLRAAYRVRVSDGSGGPTGPTQPSSSGCPNGQVKDSVLGTCANACASGSAPAAGVCLPAIPGFPAPGQQPQNNNCPQGQAADLMTGACANTCPGGSPAIGGMCLPGFGGH